MVCLSPRVFGPFFAHPNVVLGEGDYIGSYCILLRCSICAVGTVRACGRLLDGGVFHHNGSCWVGTTIGASPDVVWPVTSQAVAVAQSRTITYGSMSRFNGVMK